MNISTKIDCIASHYQGSNTTAPTHIKKYWGKKVNYKVLRL